MAKVEIKDLDKQKNLLIASYKMWEKTKSETLESMKNARNEDGTKKYTQQQIDEKISLLQNGEDDIIEKWYLLGGTLDELKATIAEPTKRSEKISIPAEDKTVEEQIAELNKAANDKPKVKKIQRESEKENLYLEKREDGPTTIPSPEEGNPLASYDIIPLPSKGECYPSKQGRIAVSYLTAIDENIIVSPNLYRDNMVLDIILKQKIRNSEINPDDLLDGDRDAIILFLRSSAYGNMYSVNVTDPKTQKQFTTEIDLSKIQYKEFNLHGDENGYFDFEMPLSKDKIKFKFLSHGDYIKLDSLDKMELNKLKKNELDKMTNRINVFLADDESLNKSERHDVEMAVRSLEKWSERCGEDITPYSHRASNELEMQIVSVNGNEDRSFIHSYVGKMPLKDATALRKYINRNTPGVDYNFEIEKPESLGGGSMKVFLQFDQFIFLVDTD